MATYKRMTPDKVKFLVVHCADTPAHMDVGVKEIRRWHLERGFFDVGYHYVIRRDGTIEKGRPDDRPGAHVQGYNGKSLGICLVGGWKGENNFTPQQFSTLQGLLILLRLNHPDAKVVGHRDIAKGKLCPGFDAIDWWQEAGQ